MDDFEKAEQELVEAVDSNEKTCADTTEEEWVNEAYLPYKCYFYPGRDCLGWRAGHSCGRLDFLVVPLDETEQPEEGPWAGMLRGRRD